MGGMGEEDGEGYGGEREWGRDFELRRPLSLG